MTFEEYYKSFGLSSYPFGVYTSEGERDVFSNIYLKPQNHSVILESLRNTSALVVGERGTGKTALSLDLGIRLESHKNLLIRIEEFSDLKVGYTADDLYKFLTERVVAGFFISYADRPTALWKLAKEDRMDLSMFLHNYLGASTKTFLLDKLKKIQHSPLKRGIIGTYNAARIFLNYGLSAATKAVSDALTKHFSSLPPLDLGDTEYFKKLQSEVDTSFQAGQREYFYLEKMCRVAKKAGFEKIYVFVDKIDEDSRFQNDADDISDYLKILASDNKILTSDLFHVVLFVWSTPFNYIKGSVRTQKISFTSLKWDRNELEQVLKKRLATFSVRGGNGALDLLSACSPATLDLIYEMSNRNPRDLWHILDKAFHEQFLIDPTSRITDAAVKAAVMRFVTEFNYYEYYPRKANARTTTMDVYKYIKHLQKLDTPRFTKDKLNSMAGTGSSTNNYVVAMENIGLIRNTKEKSQNGAMLYEIADPKVRYAMQNGLTIAD